MAALPPRQLFIDDDSVVEEGLRGPCFGDARAAFAFGAARVVVSGLSARQSAVLRDAYTVLLTDVAAEATHVRVVRAQGFRTIDTRGWHNTMALEPEPERVTIVGRDFVARIALQGNEAVVATNADDDGVRAPVENTLRVLAAYAALARGGALLHCAALVDDDAAFICFGRSGAGKSTVATTWLALGRDIVTDELCAVECEGSSYRVQQLPFAGDVASRRLFHARLPLAGVFRLAQAPASGVRALPRALGAGSLITCAPFVNADSLRLPALMSTLDALTARHSVRELSLSLGADPLPWLRSAP